MSEAIVGYTGFVGSNLCLSHHFDGMFNSKNIQDAYGSKPDLLVYSGVRAEKYLANQNPQKDLEHIEDAFSNICRIAPQQLVLISTIDVLANPINVDENSTFVPESSQAYGANRYHLEMKVRDAFPDALIVRLPALFGKNIKKNFIYDYIHRIPYLLKKEKMYELCLKEPSIAHYYEELDNGFYKVKNITTDESASLKLLFKSVEFDALHFTDSRSVFQFYPLNRLWNDITKALSCKIRLLHTATEPISAADIFYTLEHHIFKNEISEKHAFYDYRTVYDTLYGGCNGYICDKITIMNEIVRFVTSLSL